LAAQTPKISVPPAKSASGKLPASKAASANGASAKAPAAKSTFSAQQLETLSRALKGKSPAPAYARLSAISLQKSSGVLGTRAALALGYFDYTKGHFPQAAVWFARAKDDPLLAEYSLFWSAETNLAQGRDDDALAQLEQLRKNYPDSATTDQSLESLGEAAIGAKRPAEAVVALDAYNFTQGKPALLLLRGEAHELAGQQLAAVADYQALYTHFPTSDQAKEASAKLVFLRSVLADKFPALPIDQRLAHAAALYNLHNCSDARSEYADMLSQLSGADRERAQLRILNCGVRLGGSPSQISALEIADPDVNAERFYSLADYYRAQKQEPEMTDAVEAAVSRAPASHWAESALFLAGNYYWVQLDRDRASSYYQRIVDQFPREADADPAQWRVAWTATLKRAPEAAELLQTHLRLFPGSLYTPDTLYWLGRLASEVGVPGLARSYYEELLSRYPQNYFATLALSRLRALDPGPKQPVDVLASIPPPPPLPKTSDTISPAGAARKSRADALRTIAFDSSAELELRAGYSATGEPSLLLAAAQSAVDAEHYGAAIVTIHQLYPQMESHTFAEVPRDAWVVAYALPYEQSIRKWSANAEVDPMAIAGLIHQESAFEREARSPKNAIGLMQLIPPTARRLAKQARIGYSQSRLLDPDYNVRLGTLYVAGLLKQFGSIESVLAAYNAGEDRVGQWTAGQTYREPAEFVDSIPFTETRLYVELVARNADIYRKLYGPENDTRKTHAVAGH
jgi:soluble lytic murein transglycosylase